jgi:hypothetical protein
MEKETKLLKEKESKRTQRCSNLRPIPIERYLKIDFFYDSSLKVIHYDLAQDWIFGGYDEDDVFPTPNLVRTRFFVAMMMMV